MWLDRWEVLSFSPSRDTVRCFWPSFKHFLIRAEAGCLSYICLWTNYRDFFCLYWLFQFSPSAAWIKNEAACSPTCGYGCKFRRIKTDKSWLLNTAVSLHSLGKRVCSICHYSLRTLLLFLNILVVSCCVCVCVGGGCFFSPLIEPISLLTSPRLHFSYHPRQLLPCLFCILQHHSRAERVMPCVWRIIHCKVYKPLLRHSQQENMQISVAHNMFFFFHVLFTLLFILDNLMF